MQYKTLNEQIEIATKTLNENRQLMDVLDYISNLNLPNFYIAAGSIFQTIWNKMDGKDLNYGIKDIDVIYYNSKDLSVDTDLKYYELISTYCNEKHYNYEIDVSNEARMHIWKKKKFGVDIKPYVSSEDAIDKWIATVHAIGITKINDEIKIYAPYGLSDIFSKTIRPIKHKDNTKETYNKKLNSWCERFDDLEVIEW